jgi:hypothetical protein
MAAMDWRQTKGQQATWLIAQVANGWETQDAEWRPLAEAKGRGGGGALFRFAYRTKLRVKSTHVNKRSAFAFHKGISYDGA